MELRIMKKVYNKKLMEEHKLITKCIFSGLTIAQIAKKLNYSQSTVSNRMNSLFEKYSAKTRFEFILSVFSEVINENKNKILKRDAKIEKLSDEILQLTIILKSIINNFDDKKNCSFWLKRGKEFLKK